MNRESLTLENLKSSKINVVSSQNDSDELYEDSRIYVNIGPSHPAMHGTLRVMCRLNGETIEKASAKWDTFTAQWKKLVKIKRTTSLSHTLTV